MFLLFVHLSILDGFPTFAPTCECEEHPSSKFRVASQKQRSPITNLKLVIAAKPLKTGYSCTDIEVLKMDCVAAGPTKLRFPGWTLSLQNLDQNCRRCNFWRISGV